MRAVEEARGDPSTQAAFHAEVLRFLDQHAKPGERLEVPLTRNHWEATYLAEDYPLARGWHRQLDRKVNPLFYDEQPLTAAALRAWLRDNAVRWVALPDAPLDFSAARGARAAARGGPALPQARVRVGELAHLGGPRDAMPPVEGPAKLVAAGADGFDLEATGTGDVLVRQHGTPYWEVAAGDACVSEDRRPAGRWSTCARAGLLQRARPLLRPRRAAARAALRRRRRRPPGTSAVSPPVTQR